MMDGSAGANLYGDVHLHDHASALLGDQYVTNVYQVVGDKLPTHVKRKAMLDALAYKDMNLRRNQIKLTGSIDWIWGNESGNIADILDIFTKGHRRIRLSQLWAFDRRSDEIWEAIATGAGKDFLDSVNLYSPTNFSRWLASDQSLFWITGKPASGKSTTMKYLSQHPKCQKILQDFSGARWRLVHFFFDYRATDAMANSMEGMFRALLFQLIQQIPKAIDYFAKHPLTESSDVQNNDPNIEQMQSAFKSYISDTKTYICIFVDGLDEFTGSFTDLFEVLNSLAEGQHVKICLASRPDPVINNLLRHVPSLTMQDHNHSTMLKYALNSFTGIDYPLQKSAIQWQYAAFIVAQASGVFLWAHLACADLRVGMLAQELPEELLSRLNSYPSTLNEVYSRLLDKIDQRFGFEAMLTLYLVIQHSDDNNFYDSIPIRDLRQVLEISQKLGIITSYPSTSLSEPVFEARLLSRLGCLIDLMPQQNGAVVIRLIHKTLATYLRDSKPIVGFLPESFIQSHQNHVWIRIYNAFLTRSSLLSQQPLQQLLKYDFKLEKSNITTSNATNGKQHSLGEDECDSSKRLNVEKEIELALLIPTSSLFLSRASRLAHDDVVFDIVQNTINLGVMRLHFHRSNRCCSHIEEEVVLNFSTDEQILILCISHGLWNHAQRFEDSVPFSPQAMTSVCRTLLFVDRQNRLKPNSITELDFWTKRAAPFLHLADLMHSINAEGVAHQLASGSMFSRLIALRPRQTWPPFLGPVPFEDHLQLWWLASEHEVESIRVVSLEELWNCVFWCPYPPWAAHFGINAVFFLVTVSLMNTDLNHWEGPDLELFWEGLDLLVLSGEDLNAFCYPNGTLLHLIVECFSLDSKIVELIEGLLDRGIDATKSGPKGTALDIVKQFPQSRSVIFARKIEGFFVTNNPYKVSSNGQIRLNNLQEDMLAQIGETLKKAMTSRWSGHTIIWSHSTADDWLKKFPPDYDVDGLLPPLEPKDFELAPDPTENFSLLRMLRIQKSYQPFLDAMSMSEEVMTSSNELRYNSAQNVCNDRRPWRDLCLAPFRCILQGLFHKT